MKLDESGHDESFDTIFDRLAKDGWTCGWHTVLMKDESRQVVVEGNRKNVTLVWRWPVHQL